MADYGDEVSFPTRFQVQHAQTLLRVVVRDALDEPG